MIKALKKLGIEGIFLNIIKAIYDKPSVNIILNGEQMKLFLPTSGTRHGCRLAFPTPIQYSFEIPSQSNKIRARNKSDSNREGRSKTIPICR
jgi:hypothetical protein